MRPLSGQQEAHHSQARGCELLVDTGVETTTTCTRHSHQQSCLGSVAKPGHNPGLQDAHNL